MHLKSQFMAQQYVQYITLWICRTTKEEVSRKKVFYFTPDVSCRWIKLEFINCIKTKIWCVTWISYLQLVCKCKLLFFFFFLVLFCFLLRVNKCFLFSYIGSRSVWKLKNRSVWISVLCRHKFHLLQINSSEIIAAAVIWVIFFWLSLHCCFYATKTRSKQWLVKLYEDKIRTRIVFALF